MGLTKAWTEDGLPGTTARVRSIKKPLCGFVQCGFRGNGYGMSDSKDDKTISVTGKKTFSLKRPSVEQGMVRQEMGRGRTKAVVVETRKRRINRPEDENPVQPVTLKPRAAPAPEKAVEKPAPAPAPKPAPAAPARGGVVLNELSASEVEARRRALQDSRVRDVEDRKRAEEEAARRAEEEARRAAEEAENAKARAEEEARLAKEAEARKQAEEEAAKNAPVECCCTSSPSSGEDAAARGRRREPGDAAPARSGAPARPGAKVTRPETPKPSRTKGEDDRRRGKLTLTAALNDDGASTGRDHYGSRRSR
jgi:translation initiation factor IF-2